MIQNKWKLGSGALILIGVFFVGYCMITFSVIFGKSSEYASVIETEVSEMAFNIQFLEKQIQEKQTEIETLKNTRGDTNNLALQHNPNDKIVRPGVIILGMHRSGTSVLGGLMNKMGLNTGGPLIQPAEDNEKGFFERIDVVLQNDALFRKQTVHYASNTFKYDAMMGLKDILREEEQQSAFFQEGSKGLKFLNNPHNAPWMLKDPRLCITVRTWLPLLSAIPAVIFTYRHPLDVARSLNSRENEHFKISRGLRMWYVYNRRAVDQTHDLCRVVTSHRAVMQQPEPELERIYNELRQCGVAVPHMLTSSDVKGFIDIKLQHGRSTLKDSACGEDLDALRPPVEVWPTTEPEHLSLYREVMRVYCALEDRSALSPTFMWDLSIKDN